jgi:hypothetical protein
MAIQTLSFISLIVRPNVTQTIKPEGWRYLLGYADSRRNFDGEIMAFGAMSGNDIDRTINQLVAFGYIGPDNGDASDMVLSPMWEGSSYIPDWLELVDVRFFDESRPATQAWKMKNSNVYALLDFETESNLPTKGYQCDWPPYIGKIS